MSTAAWIALMPSRTCDISRSSGPRTAATMQNSVAPVAAVSSAALTSCGMSSQTERTGEVNWPDCEQKWQSSGQPPVLRLMIPSTSISGPQCVIRTSWASCSSSGIWSSGSCSTSTSSSYDRPSPSLRTFVRARSRMSVTRRRYRRRGPRCRPGRSPDNRWSQVRHPVEHDAEEVAVAGQHLASEPSVRSVRSPSSVVTSSRSLSVTRPPGVGSEHTSEVAKCDSGWVCWNQHVAAKSPSSRGRRSRRYCGVPSSSTSRSPSPVSTSRTVPSGSAWSPRSSSRNGSATNAPEAHVDAATGRRAGPPAGRDGRTAVRARRRRRTRARRAGSRRTPDARATPRTHR